MLSVTELFPGCLHLLVHASHVPVPTPGGTPPSGDCYQLLLGLRPHLAPRLERAFIGRAEEGPLAGLAVYDALHDPRSAHLLLERLRRQARRARCGSRRTRAPSCPGGCRRGCWTPNSPTPRSCTATRTS